MKIIMKRLEDLTPYENNPRINDGAVDATAKSIAEFGFKVPMVITTDGVIIAGHTRKKAAEKLGLEEVPCIIADDLTEEQIRAFRLADNRTAELAKWDIELLESELSEITEIDMSAFALNLDEIGGAHGSMIEKDTTTTMTKNLRPTKPSEKNSKQRKRPTTATRLTKCMKLWLST